ncbi:hypothetical protein LTR08_005463 [Meristemomyces frigidus]|nr:hypothetical protein LTR08_005463 [Meristemomyces frigidus]
MGFLSILPHGIETWLARLFLLLAVLTAGPWIMLLVYDALLYIWRSACYEFPGIGGRARGRQRPRAPSLTERPSGHKRGFSLAGIPRPQSESESAATGSKPGDDDTVARATHVMLEDTG